MTLNLSAYGMGLGLVMLGWISGMVVGYILRTVNIVGRIG